MKFYIYLFICSYVGLTSTAFATNSSFTLSCGCSAGSNDRCICQGVRQYDFSWGAGAKMKVKCIGSAKYIKTYSESTFVGTHQYVKGLNYSYQEDKGMIVGSWVLSADHTSAHTTFTSSLGKNTLTFTRITCFKSKGQENDY